MTPDLMWVAMAGLVFIAVIITAMTANKRGDTPGERERRLNGMTPKSRPRPARQSGENS